MPKGTTHYHPKHEGALARDKIDAHAAYDLARAMAKKAGFRLHHVPPNSESCYFEHPSRPGFLLRLSMHRSKRSPIGLNSVVSRASFSSKTDHWSEFAVYCQMRHAIGDYFLRDPEPSRYKGKRGTWEHSNGDVQMVRSGADPASD